MNYLSVFLVYVMMSLFFIPNIVPYEVVIVSTVVSIPAWFYIWLENRE